MRLRMWSIPLALLIGVLAARVASSETKVGTDLNVRTVVAVKVADAEAQKLLPAGWQVAPMASGPSQGANLSFVFIDELLNVDPDAKPRSNTIRRLAIVVPAKNGTTGAAGPNVVRVLTTNAAEVPGPYKTSAPASLRLEQSVKASDMEPATVRERWEVSDRSGGGLLLAVEYTRGVPERMKTESKVYGGPDPAFFRVYRVDQGADVLRSRPAGVDRVRKLELRVTLADLKKAFDGSEQVVNVMALPWYLREVSLP